MKKAVCVFRAFDFKDDLKSHGYSWHADSKSWAKEVEESEVSEEMDFLSSLGVPEDTIQEVTTKELKKLKPMAVKSGNSKFKPGEHCVLVSNCFDVKDKLKADGYFWYGDDKVWYKNFDSEEDAQNEASRLAGYDLGEDKVIAK